MDNIWLIVIAVSLGAVAVFIIPLILELKKTVATLRNTIETGLNPALDELHKNLKTMNSITGNVNAVAADVRRLSGAVAGVGRSVEAVNSIVNNTAASVAVQVISMKTGIIAAAGYFLTNLLRKGDRR